jgi:hypothetical protein|tara:strand:- start:4047 stop:5225 length:1179 start_codon:yes stop_codon:yes gene_type:complete
MGKSSPTPPPAPNPNELINAQANANRITQFTPYGNLLFGSVGDQGQFVQGVVPEDGQAAAFTQETPFQAQLRAATEGTGLGLGNLAFGRVTGRTVIGQNPDGTPIFQDDPDFQNPFRTAPTLSGISAAQEIDPTQLANLQAFNQNIGTDVGLPQALSTEGLTALQSDPEAFRSTIEQTLFNRQLGLLQPEFTRQREELETNLINRGIPITSDPYNQAVNRLESQQNEQLQRLAQQATLAAGQESDRLVNQARQNRAMEFGERAATGEFGLARQQQAFGQDAANVQLQNAARQQQIADQLLSNQIAQQQRQREIAERNALRSQNFNELAALLGGPQIQQASFFAPGAIDTQGAFAAQQAAQQNAFNQAMASRSADLGGLFGLAGNLGAAYLLR